MKVAPDCERVIQNKTLMSFKATTKRQSEELTAHVLTVNASKPKYTLLLTTSKRWLRGAMSKLLSGLIYYIFGLNYK